MTMAWQLFTTSTDTDAGVIEDVLASGTVTTTATRQDAILSGIGSVTAGAAGERLFIAFTNTGTNDKYTALDEVNLSVVPEPSSFALIASFLGLMMLRRRR